MRTIRVQTKEPYDVLIGAGILAALGARLNALPGKRYRRAVIVTDERVFSLYGRAVLDSLKEAGLAAALFHFAGGEDAKTLATVQDALAAFGAHRLGGGDIVVALGGGVVCDVAGFASALYLCGVDYMQVPTTLLAAVDSSVGGCCRLNLPSGRNHAGVFRQPQLVLCDTALLRSLGGDLPAEGAAHALRLACAGDAELFELLERGELGPQTLEIIARSVELKSAVAAGKGPREQAAMLLGFGATLGRGIERLSHYKASSGRALAVGMCLTADACARRGLMNPADADRIRAALTQLGLPTRTSYPLADICRESLEEQCGADSVIHLTTLERIGKAAVYPVPVNEFATLIGG